MANTIDADAPVTGDVKVDVHHITRVEGHGDLTAEIKNGVLESARFAVVEAPRFFEGIVRGLHHEEVAHIVSRICGICAVSHKSAALKALETALDVQVSDQVEKLRRIAFNGEIIGSHILHVYFLALPDFLGAPSSLHLLPDHKDVVQRAFRLKTLGYGLSASIGGRHTHPVAMSVGGFTLVHQKEALAAQKARLEQGLEDIKETVKLFKTVDVPEVKRQTETEYVSLKHPDRYALYDGDIYSSTGESTPPEGYRGFMEEYVVPYSTAKYARRKGSYMVGALARVNNNYEQLSPVAKQAAADLDLEPPNHNPFMNTIAQIVECAHCIEDSLAAVDDLLSTPLDPDLQQAEVKNRAGQGVGAVEAPRGILFHEYDLDRDGKCKSANHVIPTAQNLATLQSDLHALGNQLIGEDKATIQQRMEMLVRAYDPCISCSTH
jgi:coenzyme F420-reducing hydrogenase alpha subunit